MKGIVHNLAKAETMGILSFLFGNKTKQIQDFKERGAIILDVRSKEEFKAGNISGSKNIPLPNLNAKLAEIKKWNKPVIACCASGMRSGRAIGILKSEGVEAMNGGGWSSLNRKL